MALAFLPIIVVCPAFARLEADPIVVQQQTLAYLLDYYMNTWLDEDFPHVDVECASRKTRTNNAIFLEGWHNKLNGRIARHHPKTHQFMPTIKEEQAAMEVTIRQADQGMAPPRRKRLLSTANSKPD